jgi:hypothetical protein
LYDKFMIKRKRNSGRMGAWIATIFCSIFVVVGLAVLTGAYLWPHWALFRSGSWAQTQAVMDRIEIAESRGDKSTSYHPDAAYHYVVDGVNYHGTLFWFGQKNSVNNRSLVEAAIRPFDVGAEFPLHYNPADPSESVVLRQVAPGSWFFAVFSAVFIAIPLFIAWAAIAATRKNANSKTPSSKARTSNAALNAEPLGLIGANSSIEAFHSDTCPNEDGDPHNNQPYMVKPTTNQLTNAIGLFIVGVFWNGIVTIVGYGFLWGARGFEWIPALFLGVFLLVGVGFFCGAIYCLLASFNPKPTVVCSQSQIYPGSEFEISWTFAGNTGRIKALKLSLSCSEIVTYRAGTDTRTETKVVSEDTLFESSDPSTFAEGFALTKIPSTSMHTFKSSNNQVKWLVKLEGDIPMWPNLSETFEIQVYPPPVDSLEAGRSVNEVIS